MRQIAGFRSSDFATACAGAFAAFPIAMPGAASRGLAIMQDRAAYIRGVDSPESIAHRPPSAVSW